MNRQSRVSANLKSFALFISAFSIVFSQILFTSQAIARPQYYFSPSPSQAFDFTKTDSLSNFWQRYTNEQAFKNKKFKVKFDQSDCPRNLQFSSDKGLRLRAFPFNSTTNCGAGIRSTNTVQFGKFVVIARVPLEAQAHSSFWLNLGNSKDGRGYREIDGFEHFNKKHNSVSSGVHQGPNINAVKADPGKYYSGMRTNINQTKFNRFEVRWTPRRLRIFIGNENGSNMREVKFDKSKFTRADGYLNDRMQSPMKLRLDINPKDSKISSKRPRVLRIKSVSIYNCLQQEGSGSPKPCESNP